MYGRPALFCGNGWESQVVAGVQLDGVAHVHGRL